MSAAIPERDACLVVLGSTWSEIFGETSPDLAQYETQGKLERFHETLKPRLNLLVYTSPGRLHAAMADFIVIAVRGR